MSCNDNAVTFIGSRVMVIKQVNDTLCGWYALVMRSDDSIAINCTAGVYFLCNSCCT